MPSATPAMEQVLERAKTCAHLTGYWINKAIGQFRCYQCGCQHNVADVAANARRRLENFDEHEG